ncbi:MAG: AAA family ATPase [Anaerolineae bacterium]|nr:AAA family ATPase [Anaerolineae bacterium]
MENRFDPWTQVRTVHGFAADEVISALQKEIRRGNTENACLLAYEMLVTSEDLEQKLWDRLCVIAVEDVGLAEPFAPVLVESLERAAHRYRYGEGDRMLFAIHAVRYLCARQKDRSSDEMLNWIGRAVGEGLRPVIPDYALDMHTARGRAMGRDLRHFLAVGAQVYPEWSDRDRGYLERLLRQIEDSSL